MPIFKAEGRLIFYAHVPKCGGSSVSWYLAQRFGAIAFNDTSHLNRPEGQRWSRTSPQHVDRYSLEHLFPDDFFDAMFTIVRHPVSRLVSAFHFQMEVQRRISEDLEFSSWLEELERQLRDDPFIFDNHIRPMDDIVPARCDVFYMEQGLDGLIDWFDRTTGTVNPPRSIPRINERGRDRKRSSVSVKTTQEDLERIEHMYNADFVRFGYSIDQSAPIDAAAPTGRPLAKPAPVADRSWWQGLGRRLRR